MGQAPALSNLRLGPAPSTHGSRTVKKLATPSVAIFFPIYLELSKKILTFADNLKRSVNKTTINLYKI
jgi:hypothetical protein